MPVTISITDNSIQYNYVWRHILLYLVILPTMEKFINNLFRFFFYFPNFFNTTDRIKIISGTITNIIDKPL